MSQQEIFEFLKNKRIEEPDKFFTKKQIAVSLPSVCAKKVPQSVNKLYAFGMLEIHFNGSGWKNSGYRLKDKCLQVTEIKNPWSKDIDSMEDYRRLT